MSNPIRPSMRAACTSTTRGRPPACYSRWKTQGTGRGLWSTESGDAHSPRAQAILVNGANNGTVVEIHHIGATASAGANPDQIAFNSRQYLWVANAAMPWYGGIKVLSRALVRGTRMRHCTSSDRPGSPLPDNQARDMIWASSGR